MHIQSHLILFTMLTITLSEIWEDFILFYTLSFLKRLFLSLPEKQKCKNVMIFMNVCSVTTTCPLRTGDWLQSAFT